MKASHHIHLTSVITCSANMRDTLALTAESVLGQTVPDFEWLVLDDGSTDDTWEYLQSLKDPRVRVFRFRERQGLTAGRNYLLARCRGQAVSIADADDYLAPSKVEDHAAVLRGSPDVGMVWGRSLVQERGELRWHLLPSLEYRPGWDLASDYQACHSATTWRTALLKAWGGYDPRYVLAEAVDMFLKIGDTHDQHFSKPIAALKVIDPRNSFRTAIASQGASVSREILKNTLKRRYRFTDK